MNLANKKELAAKTFKVGKDRVVFVPERISEIKEAITRQDLKDLQQIGAILIKEVKGRKANVSRKNRRGAGKIKLKVNKRKQEYVIITRKLRAYAAELKKQGKLTSEEVTEIRKRIRNRAYKSKANLKTYIEGLRK
jgi:large subunit ribosomal protein L19e